MTMTLEHMSQAVHPPLAPVDLAVLRVRSGDIQAYAEVVERFHHPLRAWIAARSPKELDADEIALAVLVAAYKRLDDYEVGTDMVAWVWAIARHQLRGELTRLTRQRDVRARHWPLIAYEELLRRCEQDPVNDTRLTSLRTCLERLSPGARTMLELRYHQDLDSDAIAEQTGRTSAAIRKQLSLIRRSLHECMAQQGAKATP
jgi:RNA polymerase sigma-70 factor, ECF subfamily